MAFQETSRYCKQCEEQVLVRRKAVNHVLHLVLTVISGGMWLLVWGGCIVNNWLAPKHWHCARCGLDCVV